jgi:hypothetical protein
VLDESSLSSTKHLHRFFARLDPVADKVLGDLRQHQAVEAGRRLSSSKKHGMNPVNPLVVSPANRERVQLNSLIHKQLQR